MQKNQALRSYQALGPKDLMLVNGGGVRQITSYFDLGRYYGNAFRDLTFGFIYGFLFGL
ncbi:hypothetical protein NFX39_05690 [Fructobacillus sp. W13]|uniref:Uncharacterized protein n=1 Tax=Fructobacillus apis TaxID=2935017 RepID=A0ABT0ZRF1_9LACO|nr:hypothetical protein [Fructobacillus apis]MCO0832570.1 hypothetical protein [Fructobacillus apis]